MPSSALRHHALTLSYLPLRRARRVQSAMRALRIRTSARVLRKALRSVLP